MDANDAMKALHSKRSLKFDAARVGEVVAALDGVTVWSAVFVREAVRLAPAGQAVAHWVTALKQLEAQRRFTSKLPVTPAWLLEAMQAATVSDWPTASVLIALAKEGSAASKDALIADVERSRSAEGGIMVPERVRELKRWGKGLPLCQLMLARLQAP